MTITQDQVERELRTIIATDGADKVYEPPQYIRSGINNAWVFNQGSCRYAHQDRETEVITEGCIVGVWLSRFHGVALPDLLGEMSHAKEIITEGLVLRDVEVERDAAELLRQVQAHQDRRVPWGEALEAGLIDVRDGIQEDGPDPSDEDYDDEDGYNDPDPTPGDY
jgi:hypothetical protein